MMRIFLFLLAGLLIASCVTPAPQILDREDFLAEASRVYQGEIVERVINAAQIPCSIDGAATSLTYPIDPRLFDGF